MGKQTPHEEMHEFLTGYSRTSAVMRRVFRRVPSGPNCKICAAPFAGPGGAVLRHVGFGRFAGNPTICNFCIKDLQRMGAQGAEIPVSLLFADIRGSTAIGERLSPTDFGAFLNRFYRIASEAVLASDGIVDKFVGCRQRLHRARRRGQHDGSSRQRGSQRRAPRLGRGCHRGRD
jgi:adenylate cyclase